LANAFALAASVKLAVDAREVVCRAEPKPLVDNSVGAITHHLLFAPGPLTLDGSSG